MYGEPGRPGGFDKSVAPFAELFTLPGCNGALVNAKSLVWNYQVFIYTEHKTETLAGWTCSDRIIKRKQVRNRFLENKSIQFEPVRKLHFRLFVHQQEHFSFTLIKSSGNVIGYTMLVVVVKILHHQTVDENVCLFARLPVLFESSRPFLKHVFNSQSFARHIKS